MMDTARLTDERLRHGLNSNQPSRERLCMAILGLDRYYSDIKPRRPEGGPDGGRDIECKRDGLLCFGAVGFLNSVSDSTSEKRQIKKKFSDDLKAALQQNNDLKAFVFMTNVDLTPAEIRGLENEATQNGISHVDIYYRERMRLLLDGPEGLAIRYQYLSIELSDAEQKTFFSRFGKDLERLVTGRFERLEKKLDNIEFIQWQIGKIRSINLSVILKRQELSVKEETEHFRVGLELQSTVHRSRGIIIGGRDDYWKANGGGWYLGTKVFFFRQQFGQIENSWIPTGPRVGGGHISKLEFGIKWHPISDVLATEFENLSLHFHYTENLLDRIDRVVFSIDSYVFLDSALKIGFVEFAKPSLGWPDPLNDDEKSIKWRFCDFGSIRFDELPRKKDGNA